MKKPGIPTAPKSEDANRAKFDASVKESIEIITGVRGSKIKSLSADASLDDVINKINELLNVLQ